MIVACAACGKRFKGSPGVRRFKCSACGNLFTFPAAPKHPAAGHVLCSNCWTAVELLPDLKNCPACQQRVSPQHGGLAAEDAGGLELTAKDAAAEHGSTAPAGPALKAPATRDVSLDERDAALRERDAARAERAEALSERDAARAGAEQAEARLDAYRQTAVAALEPLVPEFNRALEVLRTEATQLAELARLLQDHLLRGTPAEQQQALTELRCLETDAGQLQNHLEAARRNVAERFQKVLGETGGEARPPEATP